MTSPIIYSILQTQEILDMYQDLYDRLADERITGVQCGKHYADKSILCGYTLYSGKQVQIGEVHYDLPYPGKMPTELEIYHENATVEEMKESIEFAIYALRRLSNTYVDRLYQMKFTILSKQDSENLTKELEKSKGSK